MLFLPAVVAVWTIWVTVEMEGRRGGGLGILFQRQSQWDPLMNLSVGLKAGCQPPPGTLPVTHAGPETPHGGGVVCWARV